MVGVNTIIEMTNNIRLIRIEAWKDSCRWWRNSAILDGSLSLLQLLQGAILWKQDQHIIGGVVLFCAGFMFYQAVKCVRKMREIREDIAGLEELMRQEGLLGENDNMV